MDFSAGKLQQYWLYYPIALTYLILSIAILWHWRPRGAWLIAGAGFVLLLAKTFLHMPGVGDFQHFWDAGRAWLAGGDPYRTSVLMNYPPYTVPLFALPAMLSFETGQVLCLAFNVVGAVLLIPLARAALKAEDEAGPELTGAETAVLAVAVGLSLPVHFSIGLGQPTVLVGLCVPAALYAVSRGWWVGAGIPLALAAIKPHAILPFGLLFLGRKGLAAIAVAAVLLAGLWCISSSPDKWLLRLKAMSSNASALMQEGQINDFTDKAPEAHSLIGFDRLLFCMGVRDRSMVRIGQVVMCVLVGAWVGFEVLWRQRLQRQAACALVSLFAMLFVYHRTYDATLLAIPLVYAAAHAVRGPPGERRLHLVTAMAILLLMFIHPRMVHVLGMKAAAVPIIGFVVRAVVIPYNTWLVLAAMVCVWRTGRHKSELSPGTLAASQQPGRAPDFISAQS